MTAVTHTRGTELWRVAVGIPVVAEPRSLLATLTALRATVPISTEIVLLPDGPDAAMRAVLATRSERQLASAKRGGRASCFNRLVQGTDADVLVLLECGAVPTKGWLDTLLEALAADTRHGLAGPSTDRAWNEQGSAHRDGHREAHRGARAPADTARWQELAPLYSLGDFCYAVRRAVYNDIGEADEGYGLGPCWEMDYNVRAARAGWRGVWAREAFVRRAPVSARQLREESEHFEASRRRYQQHFCGARLRGEKHDYRRHCRGDACGNFAPPDLIAIRQSRSGVGRLVPPTPLPISTVISTPMIAQLPLVSCIMPTHNRVDYALQAVRYFQQQDYPERELLVLDDGDGTLERALHPVIAADARIRHLRGPRGESIGAKRNRGCAEARGPIIAQWDDDDWYATSRLSQQAAPLLAGRADVTGLHNGAIFVLDRWEWWRLSPALHRRMLLYDVYGGTLVYRRELWSNGARYPNGSIAEDAAFLRQIVARGARLERLAGDGVFVYVRHGANTWHFQHGTHVDASGWTRIVEPDLPPDDRAFYAARSATDAPSVGTHDRAGEASATPLVTCIMPTCDRRPYVSQALHYFLRQDWPHRELLVLDDGTDAVVDLIPADPRIRYVRLASRLNVGAKRNLACEMARGELIAHWDDDDWIAPHRLSAQVSALAGVTGDAVSGCARLAFIDPARRRAWEYAWETSPPRWVAGGTLCYPRRLWARHPFRDVRVGEDTLFVASLRGLPILPLTDPSVYVALVHASNTSPRRPTPPRWRPTVFHETRALLGPDWSFYEDLAAGAAVTRVRAS